MADIIKLLPDSVANQIAAGEVIQQPSSVIKELVENAADAGATEIHIVVQDAGRTLIQVTDNGRGMSPTDARMAFERHATSKIREATDLFTLHTMGFRGEALPSICAISQVELRSATKESDIGTKLVIHGSKVMSQEPCVCAIGTTIIVKNIFYNVPARRRFMKSDSVELSNIIREFERLALVNNNIRFILDTGRRRWDLRPASFKQRVTDLWKGSLNPELLPVEVETELVRINGFISRPEHARRRNALQFLIANGRCMRHPYFRRGILSCFERLIAPDTQPCFFLRFEVNPADIDVNIHPTKSEIKFENEAEIYRLLVSAIQATLGKYQVVPSIDFTSDALEIQPISQGETPNQPSHVTDPLYNPFKQKSEFSQQWKPSAIRQDWKKLYSGFINETELPEKDATKDSDIQATDDIDVLLSSAPVTPLCLQLDSTYIITPTREGIMIIDQHRASVAILYARYLRQSEDSTPTPLQNVLFGEELYLDGRQQSLLNEAQPLLMRLGISLRQQGDAWVISSLPSTLSAKEGHDVILRTLDALQTDSDEYGRRTLTPEELKHRVVLSMARSSAVKRGQQLSCTEMEHLLNELLQLPQHTTGPDGKHIIQMLELAKIISFFK